MLEPPSIRLRRGNGEVSPRTGSRSGEETTFVTVRKMRWCYGVLAVDGWIVSRRALTTVAFDLSSRKLTQPA
jgi:hypothetical protein